MTSQPLRTAIVGLGLPGQQHAACAAALPADFVIVAGCDPMPAVRDAFVAAFPAARAYVDFAALLDRERPEVVVLATNETPRCALTLQAVAAGVRGLYVEKPIAVSFGEARAMIDACARQNVALVVNHQRRTLPAFRAMRRLILAGAIGDVRLIRASCAGDLISDGTHLVNTVRFLLGEPSATWASGMVNLHSDGPLWPGEPDFMGRRYGHTVERGCIGHVRFDDGRRAEFQVGSLQIAGTRYQYYEVIGTRGRLSRDGDAAPVFIEDEQAGGRRPITIDPADGIEPPPVVAHAGNYQLFARLVRGETREHPLLGTSAFADHEILMAIYESARLHERVKLPLTQDAFPLDLLLAAKSCAETRP